MSLDLYDRRVERDGQLRRSTALSTVPFTLRPGFIQPANCPRRPSLPYPRRQSPAPPARRPHLPEAMLRGLAIHGTTQDSIGTFVELTGMLIGPMAPERKNGIPLKYAIHRKVAPGLNTTS